MLKRGSLLGSASLAVLLAAGMAGQAQAAAKHHHHVVVERDADEDAKIDSLTSTVSDLENRLNDATAAVQQANANAQAAAAKADQAEADEQAMRGQLEGQIQTVPGEIQQAEAANKPKPSWADNTKVGFTIFDDLSYVNQTPTAVSKTNGTPAVKANGYGDDIKRAYLSIDHTFNSVYSADLTIDFAPNNLILNGQGIATGNGLQGSEAVKYAYVQGAYSPMFIVQLGSVKAPWIPFVEDVYGYRFVDHVLVDNQASGTSADWGANVHGDLGNGLFDYSLSVVDGAGYKNPIRSDSMDVEGRVNLNWHGFIFAFGGYSGDLSNNVTLPTTTPPTAPVFFQTASRFDALLRLHRPEDPRRHRVLRGQQLEGHDQDHAGQGRGLVGLRLVYVHATVVGVRPLRLGQSERGSRSVGALRAVQPRHRLRAGEEPRLRAGLQARGHLERA